jgi:ADP-ribose pyrophosphatase YjhB (NUDIX family)
MQKPPWLDWARQLQAIAQTGLTYSRDPFDQQRYADVRRIAAEMMAAGAGLNAAERVLDLFSADSGYATPKIDVRSAVFSEGRLLLVREREDGCWTLPGGWADVGDWPSMTAIREVKEESGYDAAVTKLAAVYDRDRHEHPPIPFHAWKVFFICELRGGEPADSHETDGAAFFEEHAMPALSLTRVTPAQIAHMFAHYRHPEWPASFD